MSKIRRTITRRIKMKPRPSPVKLTKGGPANNTYSGSTWDYLMRIAAMPEPRVKLLQSGGRGSGKGGGAENGYE